MYPPKKNYVKELLVKVYILSNQNLFKENLNHVDPTFDSQEISGMTPTFLHSVGFYISLNHSLQCPNRLRCLHQIIHLLLPQPNQSQLIPKTSNLSCSNIILFKTQELYLGNVVHLGELEGDAQATEERRDERAGSRERRDLDVIWGLGIHCGFELPEGLGDFPQRLMVICHLVNFGLCCEKDERTMVFAWFLPCYCSLFTRLNWNRSTFTLYLLIKKDAYKQEVFFIPVYATFFFLIGGWQKDG